MLVPLNAYAYDARPGLERGDARDADDASR